MGDDLHLQDLRDEYEQGMIRGGKAMRNRAVRTLRRYARMDGGDLNRDWDKRTLELAATLIEEMEVSCVKLEGW